MGEAEPQAPPKPAMSRWTSHTKRRRKARQDCARKTAHATAEAARRVMQEVQDQGRAAPDCAVYRCPICGAFHRGHAPGRNGGPGSGRSRVGQITPDPRA